MSPDYLAKSGTEHAEQVAVFAWSKRAMWQGFAAANIMLTYTQPMTEFTGVRAVPELEWMHAIPNGGGRSARQGADLKAEGVRGGVADICLPVSRNGAHGLYIEMKKANGVPSDVSKDQTDFARFVTSQGYAWVVCFGWQQATKLLQTYLEGKALVWTDLSPHQVKVLQKVRAS
jgi:hypothetical protein